MSNCNSCKYKRNVPGDAHISCEYPLMEKKDALTLSMVSIANPKGFNQLVKESFGFEAEEHGLRSGYFSFPMNFDPSWMIGKCQKHSDIIGEAVDYKLELNKYIDDFKRVYFDYKAGVDGSEVYKDIVSSYENVFASLKDMDNSTEENRAKNRKDVIKSFSEIYINSQKCKIV